MAEAEVSSRLLEVVARFIPVNPRLSVAMGQGLPKDSCHVALQGQVTTWLLVPSLRLAGQRLSDASPFKVLT